jgi:hypothetical protein
MSYLQNNSSDWLPIANYKAEQEQFRQFLKPDSPIRILWFYGEAGVGKSRLVRACLANMPPDVSYLSFNAGETSAEDILLHIGRRSPYHPLTYLPREVESLNLPPQPAIEHEAAGNQVNVLQTHVKQALAVHDPTERIMRYTGLTEAWVKDLQGLEKPFLLVLDNYEKASPGLSGWIAQLILPKIGQVPLLRILIANETAPAAESSWQPWLKTMALTGVMDPFAWIPVAQAMGRNATLDQLAGAVKLANGNPGLMINFIEMLPAAATETAPTRAVAGLLRRNLSNYFNDSDLRQLCFDLDVDYDRLRTYPHKQQAKQLVQLMTHDNRLTDLLAACTLIRPTLNWKL